MKYKLEVRSIPSAQQSIEEKHDAFSQGVMASLPPPWRPTGVPPVPDIGGDLSASLPVKHFLGKGFRGDVFYRHRNALDRGSVSDDRVHLTFDPSKIEYRKFVETAFVPLALSFDAYFAEILDEEFVFLDYDERKKRAQDARSGFYRLPTVFYMREDHCQRVFSLSAAAIAARLDGHVAHVGCVGGGVFAALTFELLPVEDVDKLTRGIAERLTVS